MGDWVSVVGSLAGVAVGFAGSYRLATRQERSAAKQQTALSVSEVIAATGDLQLGAHAVRTAYYPTSVLEDRVRIAGRLFVAFLASYQGAEVNRATLSDARYTGPFLERMVEIERGQGRDKREVVRDLSRFTLAQTARFFSAVAAPAIRTEDRLVEVKDELIHAVTELMQSLAAKGPEYERVRDRVNDATSAFRRAGEAIDDDHPRWRRVLRRLRFWRWLRHHPTT